MARARVVGRRRQRKSNGSTTPLSTRIGDLRSARTPHQGRRGKDIVVLDRAQGRSSTAIRAGNNVPAAGAEEPIVRRLTAGGKWIRTSGSAMRSRRLQRGPGRAA